MRGGIRKGCMVGSVPLAASMRPPQNAGGNRARREKQTRDQKGFNEAPAKCGGESERTRAEPSGSPVASMRPPQNAGGNLECIVRIASRAVASMRPPQNAGGNQYLERRLPRNYRGFNEAPANCGGESRRPGRE